MQPKPQKPTLRMEGRRIKLSPVCTNCREKHLRCDGAPQCSRCKRTGAECVFVASRRGMRPNRTTTSTEAMPDLSGDVLRPAPSAPSTTTSSSCSSTPHLTQQTTTASSRNLSSAQQVVELSTAQGLISSSATPPHSLVDLFYSQFHQAEHFIVPKQWLLRKQQDPELYFLRSVVEYIGSSLGSSLHSRAPDPTSVPQRLPNNASTVQALLVLALWFELIQHHAQYIRHLFQARDCALAIGMHRVEFAATHSEGCQLVEQSWSATWGIVLQRCTASSSEGYQQRLPIEARHMTRRMTVSSSVELEPQSWIWPEIYAGQSAYNPYQLMDASQLGAQTHAQSLPLRYEPSGTIPGPGLDFRDLQLTTTWQDLPTPVTTAPTSSIAPWQP
jgi:hypothetical protein